MIKNTKEELAYLLDNKKAGVAYVAAVDAGGDDTEYISVSVKQHQDQTKEEYEAEENNLKAYLLDMCFALYEVTKDGMIKIWQELE